MRCGKTLGIGRQCRRQAKPGTYGYCWQHAKVVKVRGSYRKTKQGKKWIHARMYYKK